MESREVEKKNHTKTIIILVVFLAIFAGVILLLMNLFKEKTTVTTTTDDITSSSSLYCTTKSKDIPDAFFNLSDAESAEQAIKVIFKNNKIDNIAYNSTTVYENAELAKKREAELNVKYGLYMQDNGKQMTEYSQNFSTNDTNVKISLFATMKQLTNATAKIFLIDTNDSLSSYTSKVLSTLYKSKGFSCEAKE